MSSEPYVQPQTYTFVVYEKQTSKSHSQFDAENLKPILLSIDPSCDADALIAQVKASPLEQTIDSTAFLLAKTNYGVSIFYGNTIEI